MLHTNHIHCRDLLCDDLFELCLFITNDIINAYIMLIHQILCLDSSTIHQLEHYDLINKLLLFAYSFDNGAENTFLHSSFLDLCSLSLKLVSNDYIRKLLRFDFIIYINEMFCFDLPSYMLKPLIDIVYSLIWRFQNVHVSSFISLHSLIVIKNFLMCIDNPYYINCSLFIIQQALQSIDGIRNMITSHYSIHSFEYEIVFEDISTLIIDNMFMDFIHDINEDNDFADICDNICTTFDVIQAHKISISTEEEEEYNSSFLDDFALEEEMDEEFYLYDSSEEIYEEDFSEYED